MSNKEIGLELDCSEGAVRSKLSNLKNKPLKKRKFTKHQGITFSITFIINFFSFRVITKRTSSK